MKFQRDQVLETVKKPKNSNLIENGRKYESRLRLFTEARFKEEVEHETAWKEFRKFMENAISTDKEIRIEEFIQFPLTSVLMTESIMSDLYKVFDAGNSFFHVDTVKKNGGDKLQKTLETLKVNNWIEEQGKEVLKSKPNTVVVVDKNERGEAYLLSVDNDRLMDIELCEDGVTCEYVMFLHSVGREDGKEVKRIALYDDERYYVVKNIEGVYTIERDVKHGSDKCPARMFVKDKLNSKAKFNRKVPLSTALAKLREWQYFDIYKFYTDHYAPFPVLEMVKGKCGVDNCSNGYIIKEEPFFANGETKYRTIQTKCKSCESSNKIGVGTKILLDPQEDKDEPTASGKFRMISNDVKNLEYIQDKLDKIEQYITVKTVGVNDIVSKEAVNEKQMDGAYESQTNVLLGIKTNLDELYVWIISTVGRIAIGDKPLAVSANFGTEWYLVSEDELQERFKYARENGFPREEVDMINNQIIETKYKGNPEQIERFKLMNLLNPVPYESLDDKLKQVQNGIISKKELIISERLLTFVRRFERENGSIVEFGEGMETPKKIEKIVESLNKYADEQTGTSNPEPSGGGEGSNG